MKNKYILGIALVAIMVLSVAFLPGVLADKPDKPVEPGQKMVYKLNIIGAPKADESFSPGADKGSGRRIFIPLRTVNHKDPETTEGGQNSDGVNYDIEKGVKIDVSLGPKFDVVDGNAVPDKYAAITLPEGSYDVYVIAKGKPNGFLDFEAWVLDIGGTDHYLVGSIDVDRVKGKPQWIPIKDLIYDKHDVAYYSDAYEDYFWQLYNKDLRNMEIRFYETSS